MAATTQPEATNPTADSNGGKTVSQFSLPAVKLEKIPHLSDYIPNLKTLPNPLENNPYFHPSDGFYVSPGDVIFRQIVYDLSGIVPSPNPDHVAYHRAGPRRDVVFEPSEVRAAIVTCGGLCPGLNTVIRELVDGLWELYGVRQIFGVTAGYRGFYSREPLELNPKRVRSWHKRGGTALETSRGGFDLEKIVDAIEDRGFNQVFSFS